MSVTALSSPAVAKAQKQKSPYVIIKLETVYFICYNVTFIFTRPEFFKYTYNSQLLHVLLM